MEIKVTLHPQPPLPHGESTPPSKAPRRVLHFIPHDWSDNGEFSPECYELAERIVNKRKQNKQ